MSGVADDRNMRGNVLRDLRGIDVDVDELRPRRELRELAGHAVVEAGPDGADQIGLVDRVVGRPRPVHAEHAEPLRLGLAPHPRREGPEAHQRAGHREATVECQLDELARRR